MDYIKFALQAVFERSLHAVSPFEHLHRRLMASKGTVTPHGSLQRMTSERREQRRQSQVEVPLAEDSNVCLPARFDQVTETGSSFYSPYTETLSVLKTLNPLLSPSSKT